MSAVRPRLAATSPSDDKSANKTMSLESQLVLIQNTIISTVASRSNELARFEKEFKTCLSGDYVKMAKNIKRLRKIVSNLKTFEVSLEGHVTDLTLMTSSPENAEKLSDINGLIQGCKKAIANGKRGIETSERCANTAYTKASEIFEARMNNSVNQNAGKENAAIHSAASQTANAGAAVAAGNDNKVSPLTSASVAGAREERRPGPGLAAR